MKHRPLIGLTGSLTGDGPLDGLAQCARTYVEAVVAAGGVAVVIPPQEDLEGALAVLETFDGLLFTGGRDIHPQRYGQAPHPRTEPLDARREAWDLHLCAAALGSSRVPVLGICLGVQEMNVAAGGSLIQHLPDLGRGQEHRAPETGDRLHAVRLAPGSRLAALLGTDRILVTTRHHQAVDRVGGEGVVAARAEDGVIEAVEWGGPDRFAVGVQWHPERNQDSPESRALFAAFVEACKAWRAHRH